MDCTYTCLTVICLDSAFKKDKSSYSQVFLKECKYTEKKCLDILIIISVIFFSSSNESYEE